MALQIHTESSDPTTLSLILEGKLDTLTAPQFDQFLNDEVSEKFTTLVLDLQALSFVSSAGLRIFAKARKLMTSRQGQIAFVNLSPQVKKVFEIVKAVPLSEVFQDPKELDAYLKTMQDKAAEEHG